MEINCRHSEPLLLGVGREIITPKVGARLYGYGPDVRSIGIHDDLTATAFAFRQGNTRAVMVSVTVCVINEDLADRIRLKAERTLGIPKEHILLCATHTHCGPATAGNNTGWGGVDAEYCETIFIPRVLQAITTAAQNQKEVTMGVTSGESKVGVNRREIKPDNSVWLGVNEWGPYNPKMTVISFRDTKGQPVANMIHYGAHGTAAGREIITRDWSGYMIDTVERLCGGITAFFNGPEGDVAPRILDPRDPDRMRACEGLSSVAAMDALNITRKIPGFYHADLICKASSVRLPLKPRMPLEEAKQKLPEIMSRENFFGAMASHYEEVIASYENGYEEKEYREIPQTIIRLGSLAFVSSPFELFSEIGMRIEKGSKLDSVLTLSNTNGRETYFPTQDQICRGGYEVMVFQTCGVQNLADDADYHYIKGTWKNLEETTCTE